MCGITGYINLDHRPISDTATIINMLKLQKHRGPDDSGIRAFSLKSGDSVEMNTNEAASLNGNYEGILGFNRLSILDLSKNGHQPMLSPNGKVILMLNGEIYNAFDFTDELEAWGYNFQSTTDTEIVLALYLKYGFEEMLVRLNGMFAIVIIELEKKEIFITRDRFGIKPIYYIYSDNRLAFSSELKSFKCLDGIQFQINIEKIDEFLLFRNTIQNTLLKEIDLLEPGHYIKYSKINGFSKTKYFDINNFYRYNNHSEGIQSYGIKLNAWLSKSVKSQLMSDVKLGCQLSGGIDSTLVTWLANRGSSANNFEAVSIIFDDPRFSEEKYIDIVKDLLQIPSHKFLMESDYYLDNIESATWHLEAPLNHPNTVGIFRLSQQAKKYVTVLLSGEGADEVFGGYKRFYDLNYPYRIRMILSELKGNINSINSFSQYFNKNYRSVMATAFMFPEMAARLYPGFNLREAIGQRKALYDSLSGSLFDKQVKYEMHTYLPDLLIRQDKMSMAHSIENRVPFLDNELVENAFSVPEKYLLLRKSPEGYNTEKYLLKKLTAETFGDEFAFRNKMGFGIPVREFFMKKEFSEFLRDKIYPGIKKRGIINHNLVSTWISDIKSLHYNEIEALWVVFAFEIWASLYLD